MPQYIILLLVIQFEFSKFESELNCLNQFQKCKAFLSLSFSPLFSAQPIYPLPFLFFFSPLGPADHRRPTFSFRPGPLRLPSLTVTATRAPPVRAFFSPVCGTDSRSPARARAAASFLARTPRPLATPYLRCRGPRLGSLRARAALSSKPCAAARAA